MSISFTETELLKHSGVQRAAHSDVILRFYKTAARRVRRCADGNVADKETGHVAAYTRLASGKIRRTFEKQKKQNRNVSRDRILIESRATATSV